MSNDVGGVLDATPEMRELMRAAYAAPEAGVPRLAKALELPLQRGVLRGDILDRIFQTYRVEPGVSVEYPLDFLSPGTEGRYTAYTVPAAGRIPERSVHGDYVMVPTFEVANSIDCNRKYLRDARWDVLARLYQVLQAGFVRRFNDDGWHVIISAGASRLVSVSDSEAAAGYFTKRLVSLLQIAMVRYGGGNTTSLNGSRLTDLYMSPEALQDIRNWDLTQVDDATRRQIFLGVDGTLSTIYGVRLHALNELGEGQEFQRYYTQDLGKSMTGSKTEIVVGLDLSDTSTFVNPVREPVQVFEDPTYHRARRFSLYGWWEGGWSVLSNTRVIIGHV